MKKLLTVLMFLAVAAKAEIVVDLVTPTDPADLYATHDAKYGKGGLFTAGLTDPSQLLLTTPSGVPTQRRTVGMFVPIGTNLYRLGSDLTTWSLVDINAITKLSSTNGVAVNVTGSFTNLTALSGLYSILYPFANFTSIHFIGDSITYGANATSLTNSYSGRYASTLPYLSYFNHSRGSANVTAFARQILPGYTHPDTGSGYASSPASITPGMLIDLWGDYNGLRDWGNSSTYRAHEEHTLRAVAVYAAQATTNLVLGQSGSVVTVGSWSNTTNYGGAMGIQTTTVNDTATFNVTGSSVYVCMMNRSAVSVADGGTGFLDTVGGTFEVIIDGISKGQFANYLAFGSRNAYAGTPDAFDPEPLTYAPWAYRFAGLGNGTHSVQVKAISFTGATVKPITLLFACGNNTQKYQQGVGPFLFLSKVIEPTVAGGLSLTTDALIRSGVANIRNLETKIAGELAQDGFPVALVDPTAYYDKTTVTDNVHPSNTGHQQLADARKYALAQRDIGAAGKMASAAPADNVLPSRGALRFMSENGDFTSGAVYGTNNGVTITWMNGATSIPRYIATRSDTFPFFKMDTIGGSFAGTLAEIDFAMSASTGVQTGLKLYNNVAQTTTNAQWVTLHIDHTKFSSSSFLTNNAPILVTTDTGTRPLWSIDDDGNEFHWAREGSTRSIFLLSTNAGFSQMRFRYGQTNLARLGTMDANQYDVTDTNGVGQSWLIQPSGGNVVSAGSIIAGKTLNLSSGVEGPLQIIPPVAQTATAGVSFLLINPSVTSFGSGLKTFETFQMGGTNIFSQSVWGDQTTTPLSEDFTNRYVSLNGAVPTNSSVRIAFNDLTNAHLVLRGNSILSTNNAGTLIPLNILGVSIQPTTNASLNISNLASLYVPESATISGVNTGDGVDGYLKTLNLLGSPIKGHTLNCSSLQAEAALTLTDTVGRMVPVWLPNGGTITGVSFTAAVAGSFTGDATNSIAMYSYSAGVLTKVAETANDEAIWKNTANTNVKVPFGATYAAGAGVYFIIGLYNYSAETTPPQIRTGPAGLVTASSTLDLTAGNKLTGHIAGGAQPASLIMSSAVTASAQLPYYALY